METLVIWEAIALTSLLLTWRRKIQETGQANVISCQCKRYILSVLRITWYIVFNIHKPSNIFVFPYFPAISASMKFYVYILFMQPYLSVRPSVFFFCQSVWHRWQSSWGQHGAHLGPDGPRWAPCWPHEPCYQGTVYLPASCRLSSGNLSVYFSPCALCLSRPLHQSCNLNRQPANEHT